MSRAPAGVAVRRATDADLPGIFALARRSLGWEDGAATEEHFAWKHFGSPFGPSPMWVAEVDERIAGFRTFLRWELRTDAGEVRRAVRAVDTATDPDFQGRGIFTALTLGALDELRADGVDFVFNTPNEQSRPGYLKMGWQVIGRLPVAVRPTHFGGLVKIARARTPATRGAVPTTAGVAAAAVLSDRDLTDALLAHAPSGRGLATHRTHEYLGWRYGPEALHYRVVAGPAGPAAGAAVFHLRRRGPAIEAVVCETLVPAGDPRTTRALYAQLAKESGADYLIRLRSPAERPMGGWFWPAPGVGPVLTAREVNRSPASDPAGWALTLGDIELF